MKRTNWVMKLVWLSASTVGAAAAAVTAGNHPSLPERTLRATFLPLDKGDATLIQTPSGMTALIGAGAPGEGSRVLSLLRARGVSHIDEFVVQSWSDTQLGGSVEVVKALHPRHVTKNDCYTSTASGRALQTLLNNLEGQRKLETSTATPNDTQTLFYNPPCQIHIVGPSGPMLRRYAGDVNNSLVIEMSFGNISLLSLGSTTRKEQRDVWQETAQRPWGHVLAIGHAGAEGSITPAWLKPLKTRYAIIPIPLKSGKQPATSTLAALRNAGVKVYRTDRDGAITVTTDAHSVTIKTALPRE